jgi:excisionase family DNA binding protein
MDSQKSTALFQLSIGQAEAIFKGWIVDCIKGIEPHNKDTERIYSRKEACKILQISLPTLHKYIRLGIVKGHRVGNRVLITDVDINNALKDIPIKRR